MMRRRKKELREEELKEVEINKGIKKNEKEKSSIRYTIRYIRYIRGSMNIRKRLKEKNSISIKDDMEARQNIQ